MTTEDRSPEKVAYEPEPAAYRAAAMAVESLWETNGNPETMILDKAGVTKIMAFSIDVAIKAAGKSWK